MKRIVIYWPSHTPGRFTRCPSVIDAVTLAATSVCSPPFSDGAQPSGLAGIHRHCQPHRQPSHRQLKFLESRGAVRSLCCPALHFYSNPKRLLALCDESSHCTCNYNTNLYEPTNELGHRVHLLSRRRDAASRTHPAL